MAEKDLRKAMLKDITIENYRVFEKLEIKPLRRLNLIIGENNTGKTSLLEAIALAKKSHINTLLYLVRRIRNTIPKYDSTLYSSPFIVSSVLYQQYLSIPHKASKEKVSKIKSGQEVCEMQFQKDKIIFDKAGSNNLSIDVNDFLKKAHLGVDEERHFRFVPSTTSYSDDLQYRLWSESISPYLDKVSHVSSALQFFSNHAKVLTFIQSRLVDFYQPMISDGNNDPLPLSLYGEGMGRVLDYIINLLSFKRDEEGKTLLIDEFENGLHFRVQEKVWDMLFELSHKYDVQIFATTHSMDCIRAFSRAMEYYKSEHPDLDEEPGQVIKLYLEAQTGKVNYIEYDSSDLETVDSGNVDIR
jgi:AAA15 family ATPase/GTPase